MMISRFACILKMMQHSLILAKYSVTVVQLAKAHNDDQQFSRDLSHNEILQMMHATFMKAGGDANAKTFAVKQQALTSTNAPTHWQSAGTTRGNWRATPARSGTCSQMSSS